VRWGLAEEVDLLALEAKEGVVPEIDLEVAKSLRHKAYMSKHLSATDLAGAGPEGS
jgi:hypothetical protein